MDRLRNVLGRKKGHLVRVLESHAEIDRGLATRFVQVAGADLIESYLWQGGGTEERELSDPSLSRDLLNGAYAARIARELGMTRDQVWSALRAFVPYVLSLASASARSKVQPPSMSLALRWSRPVTSQVPALLHPMD